MKRYFIGPKTDLDTKVGEQNFDSNGVMPCCNEYGKDIGEGGFRGAPVPTLDEGAYTKVLLTCHDNMDLTQTYPNFTEYPHEEVLPYMNDPANKFYDPEATAF